MLVTAPRFPDKPPGQEAREIRGNTSIERPFGAGAKENASPAAPPGGSAAEAPSPGNQGTIEAKTPPI